LKNKENEELNKKICKKILLSKEDSFTSNYLNQLFKSRGCRGETVMNIFVTLKKEGFGDYSTSKNIRGPPSFIFRKKKLTELGQLKIAFLESMDINTEKVICHQISFINMYFS